MARVLVVHHSRTGTCRTLARALASARQWLAGEVTTLESPDGYWPCARDALLRRAPRIRYTGPNPSTFDAVVLVSPIWCWRLSPPMRSFVRSMHGKLTKVAVVSCMGGSGASNAVAEVERLVGRPVIAKLALRQQDVQAGHHVAALQDFADMVDVSAAETRQREEASALRAAAWSGRA